MGQFQDIFHQYHREQRISVTTTGKGVYTAAVQNIYGVPPPPPEEHHKAIDNLNIIFRVMQTQSYNMEILEQSNAVLTSSKSAFMAQLAQKTVTMN